MYNIEVYLYLPIFARRIGEEHSRHVDKAALEKMNSQTVYMQRGHEHTRIGNWSESGFGSLRGAPLNISRCLGGSRRRDPRVNLSSAELPWWRVAPRARARVYARVLVPPNIYILTYIRCLGCVALVSLHNSSFCVCSCDLCAGVLCSLRPLAGGRNRVLLMYIIQYV